MPTVYSACRASTQNLNPALARRASQGLTSQTFEESRRLAFWVASGRAERARLRQDKAGD